MRYGRSLTFGGIEQLNWREIRASTDAPNQASVRVLIRLGFTLERRASVNGLDTLFFRYRNESPASN